MKHRSPAFKQRLVAYLAADRQWKREHRVTFARKMLALATYENRAEDMAFYDAVLDANDAARIGKQPTHFWMGRRW